RDDFIIHLNHIRFEVPYLGGEHIREGIDQRLPRTVMPVNQHAAEHVRTGERKFKKLVRQRTRPRKILNEIEPSFAKLSLYAPRRFCAEPHVRQLVKLALFAARDAGSHIGEGPDEIVDRAVGLRMVDLVPHELAIRKKINSRKLLRL